MQDFGEYLRAYWAYVATNIGWMKALLGAFVWLGGMFAPLGAKTLAWWIYRRGSRSRGW